MDKIDDLAYDAWREAEDEDRQFKLNNLKKELKQGVRKDENNRQTKSI